jgi:hypothetical protein
LLLQVETRHCCPFVPPQEVVAASAGQVAHTPPHAFWPVGQVRLQLVPLQVVVPPVAVGHGVHEVPHVATFMLETQLPEQTWYPVVHVAGTHVVPEQVVVPTLPVGHAAQTPPHSLYVPAVQAVATHVVPEQPYALAPVVGQVAHVVPQSSVPAAQVEATHVVPEQPYAVAPVVEQVAHVPPQSSVPVLQVNPQVVPSQVAAPFGDGAQAVHELPQVATSLLETQPPEQTWNPDAHAVATHDVPEQANVVAFVVGQTAQALPQASMPASLATHVPPQRLNPDWQTQACEVMSHISLALHCVSSAQPGLHMPFERSQ